MCLGTNRTNKTNKLYDDDDDVRQVWDRETEQSFAQAIDACEWRFQLKSFANIIPFREKKSFVERACRYFLVGQTHYMLSEIKRGLQTYDVGTLCY